MIELAGATVVGRGCRRVVYVHPDDPARCIKVQRPEVRARPDRQKAFARERRALAFYERKGRTMDHVSRYCGSVQTSEGRGDLFELVRHHDGAIAETLAGLLRRGTVTLKECAPELEELQGYLRREGIAMADLHAGNLARQEVRPGRWRLVIIDGVGNTEFIPVSDYLRWAARRKAERKWGRFWEGLCREWGSEGSTER